MKTLEKWQIISFISRGLAMAFGIVQSFLILRILSVEEWGLAQLAVSIGLSLGIYQHLGLASSSNREISASKDQTDVFKIFITALTVRYLVTIPLAIGLYLLAPKIAQLYGFDEILVPLKLFSCVIFFQGIQAILNSVISGTRRFKALFTFQVFIAFLSLILYVPFVYYYKVLGFFYAYLILEGLKSVVLLLIAFKPYYKQIVFPTKQEFFTIFKSLFSLGMTIYFVKILVLNWERSGTNLLGFTRNAQMLGIYSFALLYAKKLMTISDAVTDVNLPVFSEKFVNNLSEFKTLFSSNFNKLFTMIVFSAFSAVFWVKELILVMIGSNKYDSSLPLIMPMVFAYILYSLLDIINSSISIPAKLKKEMIISYTCMLLATVVFYVFGKPFLAPITLMAYAMFTGSLTGLIVSSLLIQRKLQFKFIGILHGVSLIVALVMCNLNFIDNFALKVLMYIALVIFYFILEIKSGFFTLNDINNIISKGTNFLRRFA